MSWSRRNFFRTASGAVLVALVSGCGFAPVYGTDSIAETYRDNVSVSVPDTVLGFRLKGRLEERLGRADDTDPFALSVDIDVTEEGVAVTPEGAVTRFTFTAFARFDLVNRSTGAIVSSGQVDSFTSYSTTDSTVATQTARSDAERRLGRILADQIVTRLFATAAPDP